MFAQAYVPESLSHQELDAYLERGWFRMGQTVFTTNFIHFHDEIYSTIWLRVLLHEYQPDGIHLKLFKQNARFKTTIQKATITPEKEELYTLYKQSLSFQPSESLQHLLFGLKESGSIYDTFEVAVYDDEKLIACGYFDLGVTSAEGISSFYDPAYRKYSLGKYLIYSKIQYCKGHQLRYFYPGYFVPGYTFFDYKLHIARNALQFLQLKTNSWNPISSFSEQSIPYKEMKAKLITVQQLLTKGEVANRMVKYAFFDANLIPELRGTGLFDFPLFLYCMNLSDINPILVFDVCDNKYRLLSTMPVWQPNHLNPDETFYSEYFIKPTYEVYATESAEEIVHLLFHACGKVPSVRMNKL